MRRILALLLVCVTCFLCACDLEAVNEIVEESEPEPETETNEKGNTYLIMPISRKKVKLDEEYKEYLPYISYDLLRDAEEKIDGECGDNQNSGFYLGIDKEGYLAIEKEVIVSIPEDQRTWGSGCYDHKHLFYHGRISTRAIEKNIDE